MGIARLGGSRRRHRNSDISVQAGYFPPRRIALIDFSAGTGATRQQQQSPFNLVVCANAHSIGQSAQNTYAAGVHSYNSAAKVVQYVKITECVDNNSGEQADLFTEVNARDWWLRTKPTNGFVHAYGQAGTNDINFTDYTTVNGSGQHYIDWKLVRDIWTTGAASIDGIFCDNVSANSRAAADWNIDGTDEPSAGATAGGYVRTAILRYLAGLRTALGAGKILFGNIDSSTTTVHADYHEVLDYLWVEATAGASWSIHNWGGFSGMMSLYDDACLRAIVPDGGVFSMRGTSGATDYQQMRYGYGLCALGGNGNGIYNFNADYNLTGYQTVPRWYNDFDIRLGAALSARVLLATDLYGRAFENGYVIVNTSTTGNRAGSTKAYDLSGQGYRFPGLAGDFTVAGAQSDGVRNTGLGVSTGNLAAADALIVVKT